MPEMKQTKNDLIIENYINGNRSEAKALIKKLNKKQLLDLVSDWVQVENITYETALSRVRYFLG